MSIKFKSIIDLQLLQQLIKATSILQFPHLYKAIFLLAYFSFLRISNFAPVKAQDYDFTRHLSFGDIIWGPPGAHVILKWAKCQQNRDQIKVVQIPALPGSLLYPVKALQQHMLSRKAKSNQPLFVNPSPTMCITQGRIRQALAIVLQFLNIPTSQFSFHDFRRSGATAAFNNQVSLQNITGFMGDGVHQLFGVILIMHTLRHPQSPSPFKF